MRIKHFKTHLLDKGYPDNFIQDTLSEVHFEDRKPTVQQNQKERRRILPFVSYISTTSVTVFQRFQTPKN